MTTPNNLRGHAHSGVTFKEVFREEIEPGRFVIITRSYEDENKYDKQSGSSYLQVAAVVSDGTYHRWTNGILSHNGDSEWRTGRAPKELRTITTKSGWIVSEKVLFDGELSNGDDTKREIHRIGWFVVVPERELLEIALSRDKMIEK